MKKFAIAICAALISSAALAGNHTVNFTVPVDISSMPYAKSLSVDCKLTYPDGTMVTQDQNAAAYTGVDRNISGGEFHGSVTMTITAAEGPAPTGYHCELYVTPSDGSGAFEPVNPADADSSMPPEHFAANGTTPVTDVSGSLGQMITKRPFQVMRPMSQ